MADPRVASVWGPRIVFAVLLATYVLCAPSGGGIRQNVDTVASAGPAQRLVAAGDIDMTAFVDSEDPGQIPWFVPVGDRFVTNRPPGSWLIAVPFYAMAGSLVPADELRLGPSSLAAAVTTAFAMAVLCSLLSRVVSPGMSVGSALTMGLGTSTWSMSGSALWPHGPTQMWLMLGLLTWVGSRMLGSGLAMAGAILTRPLAVVVPATFVLHRACSERRVSHRLIIFGLSSAGVGLALLLLYNWAVFGRLALLPGYAGPLSGDLQGIQQVATGFRPDRWAVRSLAALVDPYHGVLVLSPLYLMVVPGIRSAWREAPDWVKSAALSGAAYFFLHMALNRYNPGLSTNYRYPLEALTLSAPLFVLSTRRWAIATRPRMVALAVLIAISIAFQILEILEISQYVPDRIPGVVGFPNH